MHVFSEEINKTALTSNDVKRIQSVDTVKTYVHRRHDIKYLLCKNLIVTNNKTIQKCLTLMTLQKKTLKNMIQIGQIS